MSDSEDESNETNGLGRNADQRERQWYGSLEGQIKGGTDSPKESKSNSPLTLENIHTSNEYMELDEPDTQGDKAFLLQEFERKRRARMITVPTDDSEVKDVLRQHGEPICLFSEGPADRRNRLKDFLSRQEDPSRNQSEGTQESDVRPDGRLPDTSGQLPAKEETWYHRGPESLRDARMFVVNYSVPRARGRIKSEHLLKEIPESTRKARKQEMQNKLRSFSLFGSQNADSRPISYCCFSPTGEMIATSSWSGLSKVWQVSDCKEMLTLRGHTSYVDCVEWHPGSGVTSDPCAVNLASSSRDGTIYLWNLHSPDPLDELPKMEYRVSRVKFHPSGRFIGACVHDNSWRLWDLQAKEEVLFQEGHSKAVYSIGFQNDGALCATGGMDCFGRVWDLRTGRCVMFLSGHIGPVISVDWSPNGYHLASGSEDNTARIWDVRARKCVYSIPAHTSIISGVSYDPNGGHYLVTCSYDSTVKIWCQGSFQLLKSLEGHGQKVFATDVSPDGKLIVTSSFDRTFKLWGPD